MKSILGDKEVRVGSRTLKADMELNSDFCSICRLGESELDEVGDMLPEKERKVPY